MNQNKKGEKKKEKKNSTQATWPEYICPAQCNQQAENTVSFSCFLKLTLTGKPQVPYLQKQSAGADSWLALKCQQNPCFYFASKAFIADMKFESYEQGIWKACSRRGD